MLADIRDLFSVTNPSEVPTLTEEEERSLIAKAQAGNRRAWEVLLRAYSPLLRKTLSDRWSVVEINGHITREDLQSSVLMAFTQTVNDFDNEGTAKRLAAKIKGAISEEIARLLEDADVARVPARTRTRFFATYNAAEGDLQTAVDLCRTGNAEMTAETFLTLADILLGEPVDLADLDSAPSPTSGYATAEQKLLSDYALSLVTGDEKLVTRYAYGFIERDALPDAEIGHRLGSDKRQVAKIRSKALVTMRAGLLSA